MKKLLFAVVCLIAIKGAPTDAGIHLHGYGVVSSTGCTTDGSDGLAGSPSPAPALQNASLISSYTAKPSWCVAGVGYAVGIPTNVTLLDPAGATTGGGVTVSQASHTFTITSANVTVSGWDFSLEGGWQVIINGANATVTHNNFKVGTNLLTPITDGGTPSSGASIIANVIDGNGQNNVQNGGLIQLGATTTIEYNVIKNAFYQFIQLGASGTTSQEVKWNYFENAGLGHGCCGAHGDWIQDFSSSGGSPAFASIDHSYNTFVQTLPSASAATQGLSVVSANGNTATLAAFTANNNTMVGTSGAGIGCCAIIVDNTWLSGTAYSIANNFIDPTGIQSIWLTYGEFNGAQLTTNAGTSTGNATLHFASTTGQPCTCVPVNGWVIHDLTTPSAIAPGTTVSGTTGTTVTMSAVAAGNVGSGDVFSFNDGPFNAPLTTCTNNVNMTSGVHFTSFSGSPPSGTCN